MGGVRQDRVRSARIVRERADVAGVTDVVLVAHGSRDPRSAATVRAIARAVAAARPDIIVHDAYLDFDAPHLALVLSQVGPAIVVPLLLSEAYHARTDIPSIVAAAPGSVEIANILAAPRDGGTALIVSALGRRLDGLRGRPDGLVLAAAGTRDALALAAIDDIATALGKARGVRCVAGYASGAGRSVSDAISSLRDRGARAIGLASYFLAPGRLHDRALTEAEHSVMGASVPLGDAAEIVAIVARRIDRALNESKALV